MCFFKLTSAKERIYRFPTNSFYPMAFVILPMAGFILPMVNQRKNPIPKPLGKRNQPFIKMIKCTCGMRPIFKSKKHFLK